MTHEIAFLDVMDVKVRDQSRSEFPLGFSIEFAETTNLARDGCRCRLHPDHHRRR
jgi:hypothetical protein